MLIHVVRSGETVYSIASQYGVDPTRLALDNEVPSGGTLVVGQTLVILFPALTHTVQSGDTLRSLSARYGVPVLQLYQNNYPLRGQSELVPGQMLVITYQGEKLGSLAVNAYAYPFIDRDTLESTLPYLTYLTPFTFGITASGDLLPLDDDALLSAAARYRVAPLLHLSSLTESGSFSNDRSSLVLTDSAVQDNLIRQVEQAIVRGNYYGLDVDFEYVFPAEREAYSAFIRRLRDALNPNGHPVYAALAPKTSSTQSGLLYEAHDYAAIGAAANGVLLMTYEWGYAYGPPMAVAPLPQVRAVLDYALTQIPPQKLFLGIPNYGYDWPLPFRQGVTRARSISNRRAVEIALENGVAIEYDTLAQSPYFYYTAPDGVEHVVWFEDARSFDAKLRLVYEYGLRGVGYWNLMRPYSQNWLVLNALYDIEKE